MTDFQVWKLLRYKWICLNSYCYPELLNGMSCERMLLTSGTIERFHNLPLLLTKRSIEMKTWCEFHSTALVFLRQVELRHQHTLSTDCVAHHCNFMAWKVAAIFIWMILLLLINYHHINADIGWEKKIKTGACQVLWPLWQKWCNITGQQLKLYISRVSKQKTVCMKYILQSYKLFIITSHH